MSPRAGAGTARKSTGTPASSTRAAPSRRHATPDGALTRIEHFDEAHRERHQPGRELAAIREAAPGFRSWFAATGMPSGIATCDLIALPYPRRFGLWRAATSPAPYVRISNRMMVVQWNDEGGRLRTLVVEPTEYELAANTEFFAALRSRLPARVADGVLSVGARVQDHLRRLGITPEQVDYITFDHLHTQDLRLWLGTSSPQPDLAYLGKAPQHEPVPPFFPNAQLLVMRAEWEQIETLHPLQAIWYQPRTFASLRRDNVVVLDHDVLLGPGLALLSTPGHSPGNHTVVLNSSSGIWTQSENGIHAECYTPERSRIPGLARHARQFRHEVILNANTPDFTATQYNSMMKEKLIADRGGPGGEWVQHFASSELTPWRAAPGLSPSFTYGGITHGELSGSR